MAWLFLILGGLFEVGFTTCMGFSDHFRKWPWTVGFAVCLVLSMTFLAQAAKTLPLGTAYAVWTGIGAVGTATIGMIFFKEPAEAWRLFFIATLIGSIIGLKLVTH